MEKKFCIFDMDGTLVDSMGYWQGMQETYLAGKGVGQEMRSRVLELAKPLPLRQSTELFIKMCAIEGTPESVIDEMRAIMARHYCEDVNLKPGVWEYLEAQRAVGTVLCVASATERSMIESCLNHLGIAEYFAFFLSCAEVGCGKDHPAIYLEAARRMGAAIEDTAVFEDSLQAAQTAKRSGFFTVGVYDEHSAAFWAELQEVADEVVTDWRNAAPAEKR